MTTDKNFRIRRAIVRALYDYSGPQDLDTVAAHPDLLLENVPPELLRQEWDMLMTSAVIEALPGYSGAVAKLSAGVRLQMKQAAGNLPPLPVLFGPKVM